MDLDELQKEVSAMSPADLQKARADLLQDIRKLKRSHTLRYDADQYNHWQTLEVRLHVIQAEITIRESTKAR